MINLVVLISGRGSNLQALIQAIINRTLDASILTVISNRPDAMGLKLAETAHIPTQVLNPADYATRETYDIALRDLLLPLQSDFIVLAGFMRILSPVFIHSFAGKILNIHPSLLPHYPGLQTHERVLQNRELSHGATVHLVDEHLDSGPILGQAKLSVLANDTASLLQQRVLQLEHQLYPYILQLLAKGDIVIKAGQPYTRDGHKLSPQGLHYPNR